MLKRKNIKPILASVGVLSLAITPYVGVMNTYAEGASSFFDWRAAQCIVDSSTDISSIDDITQELLSSIKNLDCSNKDITNFNIALLPNLETLDLSGNKITSLNTGSNTKLEELYVSGNELTSLDLSLNKNLKIVDASKNKLTSITLPSDGVILDLNVSNNKLTSITLPHEIMAYLDVSSNELTSIDISNSVDLVRLNAHSNKFTSINVARNVKLEELLIDDILVYAGIVPPTETKDGYVFNLSSLKFIKDGQRHLADNNTGTYVEFTIKDTDYYKFDKENMILTVTDKEKTGEFVPVESEQDYFSYKLKVFDAKEEEDIAVPNTGRNTEYPVYAIVAGSVVPFIGVAISAVILAKNRRKMHHKFD